MNLNFKFILNDYDPIKISPCLKGLMRKFIYHIFRHPAFNWRLSLVLANNKCNIST